MIKGNAQSVMISDAFVVSASIAALSRLDIFRKVVLLGRSSLRSPRHPFDTAPDEELPQFLIRMKS